MEKYKWLGNTRGRCYECGARFPTEHLLAQADAHEKEHPEFRRAFSCCPDGHNYGDTAVFPGDCEYD